MSGSEEGTVSFEEPSSVTEKSRRIRGRKRKASEALRTEPDDSVNEDKEDETFIWTDSATKYFLEKRAAMQKKFENSGKTKIVLFGRIAKSMRKHGYDAVSCQLCRKKFDNLYATYIKHRDHPKKTGRGRKHWPYFDTMHSFLASKASIEPPEENLASTTVVDLEDNSTNTVNLEIPSKKPSKDRESATGKMLRELQVAKADQHERLLQTVKEIESERTERLVKVEEDRTAKMIEMEERKILLLERLLNG